jgi:hypothetical protein
VGGIICSLIPSVLLAAVIVIVSGLFQGNSEVTEELQPIDLRFAFITIHVTELMV